MGCGDEEGKTRSLPSVMPNEAALPPPTIWTDEELFESESSLRAAKLPELLFRFTALLGEDLERDELG